MNDRKDWKIVPAKNGKPALVAPDGTFCESRFKPDIDSRRRVEDAGIKQGEHIMLIGMGGGELPRAILSTIEQGHLVIIEMYEEILAAVLEEDANTELIADPRVNIVLYDSEGSWTKEMKNLTTCPTVAGFLECISGETDADRVIILPGARFPSELQHLSTMMDDFETRRVSSRKFSDDVRSNLLANQSLFLGAAKVETLRHAMTGSTIIVAGGGPSLICTAEAIGNKANWIAVGTAYRPLLALGIEPLFVVVTDPQEIVSEQILGDGLDPNELPPVVVFPTTASRVLASAPKLIGAIATGEGGKLTQGIRKEFGELPAGGTVTTTAIGLASLLGAAKICFAGVDLVGNHGFTHSTGTIKHTKMVQGSGRFSSVESGGVNEIRSEATGELMVDTVDGQKARTKTNWQIYARAIENLVRKYESIQFYQLSSSACVLHSVTYKRPSEIEFQREDTEGSKTQNSSSRHADEYKIFLED